MNVEKDGQRSSLVALRDDARGLWAFLRPRRARLGAALALCVLTALSALAQPIAAGHVVGVVSDGGPVAAPVALLAALFVSDAAFSGLRGYTLGAIGEGVVLDVRGALVWQLLRLPVGVHDGYRVGDLVSRVGADTTLLRAALSAGIVGLLGGGVVFVGAVAVMAFVDWMLLLTTLACVLCATTFVFASASRVREASEAAQAGVGDLCAALNRALGALRTVKACGAQRRETRVICGGARVAHEAGMRSARLEAAVEPAIGAATQAAFVLVLGVGGARLASGVITTGELVTFLLCLLYMVGPLVAVFGSVAEIQRGAAAVARINEVLELPVEGSRPGRLHLPRAGTARAASASNGEPPAVEFSCVTFGYREQRPVLRGLSFSVPRFSRTALVGPSGAGKSTVFALIERFYEPEAGTIFLDGTDVGRLPPGQLRRRVGYVEQDAPVLAGSIRSNILYADPEASAERVSEVLDLANLRSFVEELPEGLDTEVGDRGVLLSGGERQRIAIARALLVRPRVLLLDEVTSALDAASEAAIREAVMRLSEECTVLTIAHRLSTVVDADRIFVLKDGEVSGAGDHESLLASSPLYRQLAAGQLVVGRDGASNGSRGAFR